MQVDLQWEDDDGGAWLVRTEWRMHRGAEVLTSVTVLPDWSRVLQPGAMAPSDDDPPMEVTAKLLRSIPMGTMIREALDALRWEAVGARDRLARDSDESREGDPLSAVARMHDRAIASGPRVPSRSTKRRDWLNSDYAEVAVTYCRAVKHGEPARQAVVEAFDVSPHFASKLIREARDRGLILGDPKPGTSTGRLAPELADRLQEDEA